MRALRRLKNQTVLPELPSLSFEPEQNEQDIKGEMTVGFVKMAPQGHMALSDAGEILFRFEENGAGKLVIVDMSGGNLCLATTQEAADGGASEKQIVSYEPLTYQRMRSIAQKELCPDDYGWLETMNPDNYRDAVRSWREKRLQDRNETAEILAAVERHVEGTAFSVGALKCVPEHSGCFRRNGKWFVYVTDEHAFCTINGPYNVHGVICACLKKLHVKNSGYQWETEEEREIYLNNHFRNFAEIDAYMENHTEL